MDESKRNFLRSLGQMAGAGAVAVVLPGCLASRFIFTPRISVRTGKLQISDGYTHHLTVKSQKEGEADIADIVMTDEPHNEESWMHVKVPGYEKELWAETGVEQQEGSVMTDTPYLNQVLSEVEARIGGKHAEITRYHIHPFAVITRNYTEGMIAMIKAWEAEISQVMQPTIDRKIYLDQEKLEFMALPSSNDFVEHSCRKKEINNRGHYVYPSRVISAPGMFEFYPNKELEKLCQDDPFAGLEKLQAIHSAATKAAHGINENQVVHELQYAYAQGNPHKINEVFTELIEKMAGPADLEAAMAVMAANGAHVKYYRQREILPPQQLTF